MGQSNRFFRKDEYDLEENMIEDASNKRTIDAYEQKINHIQSDIAKLIEKRDKISQIQLNMEDKYRTLTRIEIQIDALTNELEFVKYIYQRISLNL